MTEGSYTATKNGFILAIARINTQHANEIYIGDGGGKQWASSANTQITYAQLTTPVAKGQTRTVNFNSDEVHTLRFIKDRGTRCIIKF